MLGTGSLLAFPGSMIGAALAGLAYSRYKTLPAAMAGEIFGTGIIGGFVAWIMATLLLGSKAVAWFFIPAVFGKHHRWQRYRLPAAQNRLFQAVQQQRR